MTKNKKGIWCIYCQKYKVSHKSLDEILIHERDDVPDGIIYIFNEGTMYTKPKWRKERFK